jgi:hypothetical protein
MPFEEISTAFMITPVDTDMTFNDPLGQAATEVYYNLSDLPVGATATFFDRDENAVSGQEPETVVCVGRVDAEDLLSLGALALVPDGGWSLLAQSETYDPAVIIKLEYGVDTFNDEPMMGTFNNGFVLPPAVN